MGFVVVGSEETEEEEVLSVLQCYTDVSVKHCLQTLSDSCQQLQGLSSVEDEQRYCVIYHNHCVN